MKRFIKFIVVFAITIFFAIPVFAEDGIFVSKIVGSSDDSNVILNATDKIDIQFNELEQSAIYDITLKNNTDKVIYIHDVISENLSEDFIRFSLNSNSVDKKIEPNKETNVSVLVETLDIIHAGRNIDDEATLKLVYGNSPINPNTSSNVIILFGLVFIILLMYLLITKRFSQLKGLSIFIFIVLLVSYSSVLANNNFVIIKGNVKYSSKNLLQSSGVILNNGVLDYSNATSIWKESNKVKNIVISDDKSEIGTFEKKFDLTTDSSENVLGYFVNNNDDNVPYDLYIQSEGVIYAPSDSTGLFAFSNVESIEGLGYVEFDETTKMTGMFKGNKKLKKIDVSAIDVSSVTDTSYMFKECDKLEISKDDFDLDDSVFKNNMFPSPITILSGNINTIGSIVSIGDEEFYIIGQEAGIVKLFAKDSIANCAFSDTDYWDSAFEENIFPYVYNENSNAYPYVQNYKIKIEQLGVFITDARLISYEELNYLGCDPYGSGSCSSDRGYNEWLWSDVEYYWSGSIGYNRKNVLSIFFDEIYETPSSVVRGVRPVIEIPLSEF